MYINKTLQKKPKTNVNAPKLATSHFSSPVPMPECKRQPLKKATINFCATRDRRRNVREIQNDTGVHVSTRLNEGGMKT